MTERTTRNRFDTEQRLIDVAIKLIRENGVLAGLNLREVAEGAGVNRGNIYHYFGSRRDLLRAAISQRFETMTSALVNRREPTAPFVERRLQAFRESETVQDSLMRALLIADGDDDVDPMPRYEELLSLLRQDVIDGQLDSDQDLEALQVTLNALLRGYRIFRAQYAKRIDTDTDDLDARVTEIVRIWLSAMTESRGKSTS